jgi:hypothetical protein
MTILRDPGPAYPPSHYDHHLCLKPPLLLWLAVLYLSRAVTLPVAMAIGSFAGVNADAIALVRRWWSLDALLPAVFALAMLGAFCRRVPAASQAVRWLWARGRAIIGLSAGLDLGLTMLTLLRAGEIDEQGVWSLLSAAIDAYFLFYVLAARRVRDTFAEFPAPEAGSLSS